MQKRVFVFIYKEWLMQLAKLASSVLLAWEKHL